MAKPPMKMPFTDNGKDRFGNRIRVGVDSGGTAWQRIGNGSHTVRLGSAQTGEQARFLSEFHRSKK